MIMNISEVHNHTFSNPLPPVKLIFKNVGLFWLRSCNNVKHIAMQGSCTQRAALCTVGEKEDLSRLWSRVHQISWECMVTCSFFCL